MKAKAERWAFGFASLLIRVIPQSLFKQRTDSTSPGAIALKRAPLPNLVHRGGPYKDIYAPISKLNVNCAACEPSTNTAGPELDIHDVRCQSDHHGGNGRLRKSRPC